MFKNILILALVFIPLACTPQHTKQHINTPLSEKTDALIRLGDNMLQKGDIIAAQSFYLKAHDTQPSSHIPIFKAYDLLIQAGDIETAGRFMKQVTQTNDTDITLAIAYARFLMQYKMDQALPYLTSAYKKFDDLRFDNWYGVALDLNGDHKKAQEIYTHALKTKQSSDALKNNLALSYAVTGNKELALNLYQNLIDKNPRKILYKRNKGIIHILNGENDLAKETMHPDITMVEINQLIKTYKDQMSQKSPLALLKMINNL